MHRRNLKLTGICIAAALLCGCASSAEQDSESKEPPGIKVGEKAPDFKLKDQQGQERALKEFFGEPDKEADATVIALVFYRSADW